MSTIRIMRGRWGTRLGRPGGALLGIGFLVALILVWEALKDGGHLGYHYLPRPVDVVRAFGHLAADGELAKNFGHTTLVTLEGWAIAGLVGVFLGTCLGLNNQLWRFSMASFEVLRSLPPIAFVPAALLVAGFSAKAELAIVAYGAFLPTLIYTIAGIRQVTSLHYEVASTLRLSGLATLRTVTLPSAAGTIFVGLRIALGLSLSLAVVSEMVGNPAGVGNQLVFQQQALNAPNLFVYVLGLGVLGVILNALLQTVVRVLVPAQMLAIGTKR